MKKSKFTLQEIKDAARAMQVFGGGFMKALGLALERADIENTEKIINNWEEDIIKYIDFSKITEV